MISYDIELRFDIDATRGICAWRARVTDWSRCRMISHDRTADQSHEYLGYNDFFGQGGRIDTILHHNWAYWWGHWSWSPSLSVRSVKTTAGKFSALTIPFSPTMAVHAWKLEISVVFGVHVMLLMGNRTNDLQMALLHVTNNTNDLLIRHSKCVSTRKGSTLRQTTSSGTWLSFLMKH